jgi:hypothetical protein
MDWCEPAASLIEKLGGLSAVARWLDVRDTTVQRFRTPKSKRGTGGSIPHWHIPKIIALGASRGVKVTIEDCVRIEDREAA